jgi:ABC-type transporter Mla maintaining outer membrane lipid asymmetry ATPase subunit MlaF
MMSRGRVVATGTLEEVRANPDPWVQQFLNRIPEGESSTDRSYLRELIEPLGAIGAAG